MPKLQLERLLFKCLSRAFKKLVSVLVTFAPMIIASKKASKKADVTFKRVPYIRYLICFKKKEVQVLFNSGSEVSIITPAFASKLGFKV